MSFQLNSVVPWGRNCHEYRTMFQLTDNDMKKKIAGFGDGPASFNYEATQSGSFVTSFDPIYHFSKVDLQQRIEEVRGAVMQQMKENQEHYIWKNICSLEELEHVRMSAMQTFLQDYEQGKKEKRYIYHELPSPLPCKADFYDIGLSSHFLLMYTILGYEFHIQAITEMLRVCKEVRIFPIVDLDGSQSKLIAKVVEHFRKCCVTEIRETEYEFQKGGNKLLILKK